MRKRIRAVLFLILIEITIIGLSGCKKEKEKIDFTDYILTAQVNYDGSIWEIYKSTLDNTLYIMKDSKIKRKDVYGGTPLEIMTLPNVVNVKKIESDVEITHATKKSNIVKSLEHLNSLYEDGYTKEFEGITNSFYEVYLKKENVKLYKRLIITGTYIIEYNTEIINFNIDDYI